VSYIRLRSMILRWCRERDRRGRRLSDWQGCRVLADGDVFLMNSHPGSLDGRYFGLLPISSVLGLAEPSLESGNRCRALFGVE
jgi:type IV secretory pathway protease TraF